MQQQQRTSFASRLQLALDLRGVRRSHLAQACGFSPSTVTQWLSGETKTYDAHKVLETAKFLRVRPEWLIEGEGPMESSEAQEAAGTLFAELPAEQSQAAFDFVEVQLRRSLADDPVTLGNYLKMIDRFRSAKK